MKTKKKLTNRGVMNEIDRVANERRMKPKPIAGHVCGLSGSRVTITVHSNDGELHTILTRKHLSGESVPVTVEGRAFEFIVIEATDWTDGTHFQFATLMNLDVK